MSDSHLNYKHTNNPPLQNGYPPATNAKDDSITFDNNQHPNIDMNQLIQSAKEDRQRELEEEEERSKQQHKNTMIIIMVT